MSLNRVLKQYAGWLSLVLLLAGCAVPTGTGNPYQAVDEPDSQVSRPVIELQQKALTALHQNQNTLAVGYLQRAIKIQPRNALSWHYLARSYWQQDDFSRCLSMLDRSSSYAPDKALRKANQQLRVECQ